MREREQNIFEGKKNKYSTINTNQRFNIFKYENEFLRSSTSLKCR